MQLDGDTLRLHRENLGLTQAQLAKRSGYDTRTIQRAEAGTPIQNTVAATLAQALEVKLDRLRPRQEDLFDRDEKSLVTLVECRSGKTLFQQIRTTAFLEIERDFEPMSSQREVVTAFGDFIDKTWITPWAEWQEKAAIQNISEAEAFEFMIQAGEILEGLADQNLRVMTAPFEIWHERIYHTEFEGSYAKVGAPKDTRFASLIICVTDRRDRSLARYPENHVDFQRYIDEECPF